MPSVDELARIRTGRASTALLDHLKVEYYGNPTPLNQVGSVAVADARTLSVTVWDKSADPAGGRKRSWNSDLGLNPMTAGEVIRIPLPAADRRAPRGDDEAGGGVR